MELIAVRAVARKELLRIRRDPRTLLFIIIFPIFMLILYGFGIRYDVRSVPVAVLDLDQSQSGRDYLERFFSTGYFVRAADVDSYGMLAPLLDAGRVRLAVVIPSGFGRDLALHKRVAVQALLDGTDNNTASIALGYFNAISRTYSVEVMLDTLRQTTGTSRAATAPAAANGGIIAAEVPEDQPGR